VVLRRLILVSLATVFLSGCDFARNILGIEPIAPVEVWNTTTVPIFLVDKDGQRIDVPACGHAAPKALRVDMVEVRTEAGYIYGFGTQPDGARQYLIFVAVDGASELTTIPPIAIPPCRGRPNVQVGA
jgi:hypothetical protein